MRSSYSNFARRSAYTCASPSLASNTAGAVMNSSDSSGSATWLITPVPSITSLTGSKRSLSPSSRFFEPWPQARYFPPGQAPDGPSKPYVPYSQKRHQQDSSPSKRASQNNPIVLLGDWHEWFTSSCVGPLRSLVFHFRTGNLLPTLITHSPGGSCSRKPVSACLP